MRHKKLIVAVICMAVILAMAGCGNANHIDENKPTVVCTGFAQYDWVLNILGDETGYWNVIRINDKGADMHSYQPSAEDMIIISQADLLIYTGGMSEEWIEDAMESQDFKGKAYALMENCELICMEEDHGHERDHGAASQDYSHEHQGHNHDEYDEHVWLSLENAEEFCEDITELLYDINPSETYKTNSESYIEKLEALDENFEDVLWEDERNVILFADRFPFRYLAEDYDLEWYAAFPGCSAETEASFDTLKELSNMVVETDATAVFVTETGDDSLAKTVIANSGKQELEIIKVNSMQSVPKEETRGYLEIMEDNLEAVWTVLP